MLTWGDKMGCIGTWGDNQDGANGSQSHMSQKCVERSQIQMRLKPPQSANRPWLNGVKITNYPSHRIQLWTSSEQATRGWIRDRKFGVGPQLFSTLGKSQERLFQPVCRDNITRTKVGVGASSEKNTLTLNTVNVWIAGMDYTLNQGWAGGEDSDRVESSGWCKNKIKHSSFLCTSEFFHELSLANLLHMIKSELNNCKFSAKTPHTSRLSWENLAMADFYRSMSLLFLIQRRHVFLKV